MSAGLETAHSSQAWRRTDKTADDLHAEAFSPDRDLITTDGRNSDGARDQEGGSHEIIASTARRAVGEQAISADNRTCGGVELPGADCSAGSPSPEVLPNYDVNECWRQLSNIDTEEINNGQAVGRRSEFLEFLEEQKLDESLAHYLQLAEADIEAERGIYYHGRYSLSCYRREEPFLARQSTDGTGKIQTTNIVHGSR